MAYKFQVGSAILSGSLVQEGTVEIHSDAGAIVGVFDNTGFLSGAAAVEGASFTADGAVTAGSLVVGSADMSEADLEQLDGITAGTAAASKALVLDASKNIATIGTVGCGAITSTGNSSFAQVTTSGRVIVDDATEATTTTDGSLQTDGGLSVAKSAVIGDDLDLLSNGAIFKVGNAQPFTLTHSNANNTLMATADHRLAFGDAGDYITGDGTDLKIVSSGLLDLTGDTKVTGFISGSGVLGGSAAKISGSVLAVSLESEADITVGGLFKMPTVTSGHILVADGTSFQEVAMSGDIAIASGGATTIQNDAVESGMLNDNVISGQAELASGLALTDELIVSDAGTIKRMDISLIAPAIAGAGLASSGGQLTVQGNAVTACTDGIRLSEGYNYWTGSVSSRCELPSGSIGDVVTVKAGNLAAGQAVTITGSFSDTVDGATSILLESPFAAVTCVYMRPGEWKIV